MHTYYHIAGYFRGMYILQISRKKNFHKDCTRKVTMLGTCTWVWLFENELQQFRFSQNIHPSKITCYIRYQAHTNTHSLTHTLHYTTHTQWHIKINYNTHTIYTYPQESSLVRVWTAQTPCHPEPRGHHWLPEFCASTAVQSCWSCRCVCVCAQRWRGSGVRNYSLRPTMPCSTRWRRWQLSQ